MHKKLFLYILNITMILIVLFSWYFFIYAYVDNLMFGYSASLKSLRSAKSRLVKSRLSQEILKKEVEQLKLKQQSNLINENVYTYSNCLSKLIDLISFSGIALQAYTPKKIVSKNDHNLLNINLVIKGSFFNFLNFFKSLEKYNFIECKAFSIKSKIEGELECSLNLSIKFLED